MNCDVNSLSSASSCIRCLSDSALTAAQLSLLCSWANVATSGGGGAGIPITEGLQLGLESSDFDALPNMTQPATWTDKSGSGHDYTNKAAPNGAFVDTAVLANGHVTLRFQDGVRWLSCPFFLPAAGLTGLEYMCVARQSSDPPAGGSEACFAQFNHLANFPSHTPFTDAHIYETFGRTTRPDDGDPTASFSTAFRLYNVASAATNDLYDIWVDQQNLEHLVAGYVFQSQGAETTAPPQSGGPNYYIGVGWRYDIVQQYFLIGNIAAIYLWNRRLTTTERATMRAYCVSKWGVNA